MVYEDWMFLVYVRRDVKCYLDWIGFFLICY